MISFKTSLLALALAGVGAFTLQANAAKEIFGNPYQPVQAVEKTQAQIVYYRTVEQTGNGAANVYVDNEFQTALMPGGYSAFCVAPGQHMLASYMNDAPLYQGKVDKQFAATLEGGRTYFIRVDSSVNGRPDLKMRAEAENELRNTRQQTHVLSRASSVEACQFGAHKDYTLSGDVLFRFGKSGPSDITGAGRQAIGELIKQLHQDDVNLNQIQVIGHTDDIGRAAGNVALGQKRANTIRQMLIDGGLPASALTATSAGSSEPVVTDCHGSRNAQIECKAPNRRVVVRVATNQ
jgi:OOP family OmpA-OmpF porin